MKIVIVGCGKIGTTIVESLLAEGHDIIAVDNAPSVINEITNIHDVMGVCGNASDFETLSEAEVSKAELFVAVTGSDEMNMLSCFIAKQMGAAHTVARIRNPEYNANSAGFLKQSLGLSMSVNPDLLAAQELYRVLQLPAAANVETFSRRNFEMIELKLHDDSPLDGMKLIDIRKKYPYNYLVCAVLRGEEVFIPDGNFELHGGDRIGITATMNDIQKLFRDLGLTSKQTKNVMLLGASRTAFYLTKMLIAGGVNVKAIEKDKERAVRLLDRNPNAVVIHGDGTNNELLLEEGLTSMDAFVSLTGMDEQNILVSYAAADAGVPKVITKVNTPDFYTMAQKLGLDTLISPQKLISDVFLRYARALENSLGSNIETMYKLMNGKAEALEFTASREFKKFNIPLKDMKFKSNIIIAGIIRGRKVMIPRGEDVIMEGDRVVVISSTQGMTDLTDIVK